MTTLDIAAFLRIRTTLLTPRSCRTVLKRTGQTTQNSLAEQPCKNTRRRWLSIWLRCALYTCTFTDPAITVSFFSVHVSTLG
jgi:hypothetical protein